MKNKEQERIAELEKQVAELTALRDGLVKRVGELESQKAPSKSKQQAEAGLALLKQGPVTQAQFKALNQKYPSDVAYHIRNLLKIDVKTVRLGEGKGTVYMLPEHFAKYQEGLKEEKEAAEKAKAAAKAEATPKEAPRQAPAQVSPAVTAGATKAGTRAAVLA